MYKHASENNYFPKRQNLKGHTNNIRRHTNQSI
jgi:hypothetical protein